MKNFFAFAGEHPLLTFALFFLLLQAIVVILGLLIP